MHLEDSFGRRFSYLRLSVTDACNFKCAYCLPDGYDGAQRACAGGLEPLSVAEIGRLTAALAELGITKVRLTGGEPTLRRDLEEIIRAIRNAGVSKIALTTNGYRLKEILPALQKAGLSTLNVSVDSLNPQTFQTITGQNRLNDVLQGIELAYELGFSSVKVNVVLLKGLNDQEIPRYEEWAKSKAVRIRFIELMRTQDNEALFRERHLPISALRAQLEAQGWRAPINASGADHGPAIEFEKPGYAGSLGLIAPYSENFCAGCNRLRVSSTGALRLCLFGEGEHSLRDLLASDAKKEQLQKALVELLMEKKASHRLLEGRYGATKNLASIGG